MLIHEATFDDDLLKDARIKSHSTTSQAIAVGKKMKAKTIILTHFSTRYFDLPQIDDNINGVGIAFDHMKVSI